jgi:hypothetical protein
VLSRCGLSPASPKISLDAATKTRAGSSSSRTTLSSVAVEPAIAASVSAGFSQDAGT